MIFFFSERIILSALSKTIMTHTNDVPITAASRWPTNFYYSCDNDFIAMHITLGGACVGGVMTGGVHNVAGLPTLDSRRLD